MAIGERLARGYADNTVLDIATQGTQTWKKLTAEFDNFPTPPTTAKGARKFLNHVQNHIDALSIISFRHESRRTGPTTVFFYFDIPNPGDVAEFCITKSFLAPLNVPPTGRERMVYFSHHALARTHQRTGGIDWQFISGEFKAAIPFFQIIRMVVANGFPLLQFFVPGQQGVFAGVVDTSGKLIIKTYIGESNMSKRWADAFGMFERVKGLFPNRDILGRTLAERLLEGDSKLTDKVANLIANELASDEFCWVMAPYESRPDPAGDKWLQALGQRDAL